MPMKHFTYIIFSKTFNIYYKGYSTDPQNRLTQHNQNEFRFTTYKGPWELVYFKEFDSKTEALIEEKG